MKHLLLLIFAGLCILSCRITDSGKKYPVFSVGQHKGSRELFSSECCSWDRVHYDTKDSVATERHKCPVYLKAGYKTASGKSISDSLLLFFAKEKPNEYGIYSFSANPLYFEYLTPVSVVGKKEKFAERVGIVKPELLQKGFSGLDLLILLAQSEVIITYMHLYADLSLVKSKETAESYSARFAAVHHFCTSDCFEAGYSFIFVLDKKSGLITVELP